MGTEHSDHGRTGRSRTWRGVRLAFTLLMAGAFGGLAVQCSSSSAQHYQGSGSGGSGNGSGGGNGNDASASGGSGGTPVLGGLDSGGQEFSPDAFFVNDPPPANCADGGGQPPAPGGTPECPDDKNLQNCPCKQVGDTAPCWPGYRKNRNHGDCKDGTTTCVLKGENQPVWGACQGYAGIDSKGNPLGTSGPAACGCFSHGLWNIANTSPCFACTNQACTTVSGAVSTLKSTAQCPQSATTLPGEAWSADTVSADCTGYFKLCYTLKALSAQGAQPAATDCVMKQVCTEAHYDVVNQTQAFPDLAGWLTDTPAEKQCAQAFVANGGYAEMSVDGQSDECEKVKKVFATVTYCPLACSDKNNPNPPAICSQCKNGGSGGF